jgi:lipopolysaccharide transport system ATP-binding protein
MEGEVLIKIENVKKKFCRSIKRSMVYGVSDISKDILGLNTKSQILRKDEFWSLDDISFEVKRGECLGIIGANGAGKSTLLKMLNGIILPDGGKITMKGKVGALIEVGAGFHPMLSGRENIYINGSILGMSKKEIDENFDSIVEFSELKDSIDMPVKHYSSGMYVRLGFAIAAHVEPDILILDEVLAVGDMAFVAKCFQHLSSIRKKAAIILVSHDMRNISRICDKALFINDGKQSYLGRVEETINNFREKMSSKEIQLDGYHSDFAKIKEVNIKKIVSQFDDVEIEIDLHLSDIEKFIINIQIHREDGTHCCAIMSDIFKVNALKIDKITARVILKEFSLMPGNYLVSVSVLDEYKIGKLAVINHGSAFSIIGPEDTQGIYSPNREWSIKLKR